MSDVLKSLALSLEIAAPATLLAMLIAVPLASATARRHFVGKSLLEGLILLPMVLPPTVVGYAILIALGRHGWISGRLTHGYSIVFTIEGAILAATIVAFPLLYLPARAGFAAIDRDLLHVAKLEGASTMQAFWLVSVPLASRGVASGTVLAFARALGEFGATLMVFGWQPGRTTLPISIYADFEQGVLGHATPAVAGALRAVADDDAALQREPVRAARVIRAENCHSGAEIEKEREENHFTVRRRATSF